MNETDLARYIQSEPLTDTHEHLLNEAEWTNIASAPDILQDLFGSDYMAGDLRMAGATAEAIDRVRDRACLDLESRLAGILPAWGRCRHTGFGEAIGMTAQLIYGIDEISAAAVAAAHERWVELHQPGQRRRLLTELAGLDCVHVHDAGWDGFPDPSAPDYFLYDMHWWPFCSGSFSVAALAKETELDIHDITTLRRAIELHFRNRAHSAVALKTAHAYDRALAWSERSDGEVAPILGRILAGAQPTPEERTVLGDWCWSRGVELAIEHRLPFKIHTGYLAGVNFMRPEKLGAGQLIPLFIKYPDCRFVLMHAAYPYCDEVAAIAKHFTNVWIDLCWVWGIDPYGASDLLRRMIHTVPDNKLFAFGGDTITVTRAVAYALQARRWLTHALQAEVNEDILTEREAMSIAARFMHVNQQEVFNLAAKRAECQQVAQPA